MTRSQNSEHLVPSAWTQTAELGAGIYLLHGRTHFAGRSSAVERRLIENGALLLAVVTFDREPDEAFRPDHPYHALPTAQALRLFGAAGSSC